MTSVRAAAVTLSAAVFLSLGSGRYVAAHDPFTRVTWTRDISPIIQSRCVRCHTAHGKGPMALTTYEEARPWAKAIREEVLTRRMPKWHAARGYGDFSNDPSLSPFEIALIVAWADGGAPRGLGPAATTREERPQSAVLSNARTIATTCTEQSLAPGSLVAVRPQLESGGSVGIVLTHADGGRDVVGWIRDFDPEFATTYTLRSPLIIRDGSRLVAHATGRCSLTLFVTSR